MLKEGVYGVVGSKFDIDADSSIDINQYFVFDTAEPPELQETNLSALVHVKGQVAVDIEFFTLEDPTSCPLPDTWYVKASKRVIRDTKSDECVAFIQELLEDCEKEHDDCNRPLESPLPNRVIDIGLDQETDSVKLYETRNEGAQYICLSHCWGATQPLKTTKSTLGSRKQGILLKDLPATFLDAIWLTRRLGLRYIWIDSICIIQDSREDWETESAQMCTIYERAYLTIAATRSSNGNGGLFSMRSDIELTGETSDGESYRLYARRKIEHILSFTSLVEMSLYPLLTRAWVFQERLLSRRVIHFGPQELVWECREITDCECGEYNALETALPEPKVAFAEALVSHVSNYYKSRVWHAVVMQYSDLSITKQDDLFPAIGGMARLYQRHRNCGNGNGCIRVSQYKAGLWEDSLLDDLHWRSHKANTRSNACPLAPTWSWASVKGNIYYDDAPLYFATGEHEDERNEKDEHYSQVVECRCEPSGLDEFGQLKHGILQLRGPTVDATMHWKDGTFSQRYGDRTVLHDRCYVTLPNGSSFEALPDYNYGLDRAHKIESGLAVCCLQLSSITDHGRHKCIYSLILRCIDSSSEKYERIGIVLETNGHQDRLKPTRGDWDGSEMYGSARVKTLTIM
ncbi:HET-domain-containing protein [Aulographum hederae CBS 113979]|uniref:HET-domain-containing protein n=1 Tax=Aulographum hederae CBS 113979 TaxID=1176131 RepID=A0A6G1H3Q9_9PEZI|nr:HET-domain-containing protein [Aulographum hederae CBS 113979]